MVVVSQDCVAQPLSGAGPFEEENSSWRDA